MKIVFSTKNVSRQSFLDTCRYAYDYGLRVLRYMTRLKKETVITTVFCAVTASLTLKEN